MTHRLITTALFCMDNKVALREIPCLRGALLHLAQGETAVLFHDHVGEELRYRYPMIQYRENRGRGMVFAVEEGIEAMKSLFLLSDPPMVNIGRRREPLLFTDMEAYETDFAIVDTPQTYSIRRYLPLNQSNYAEYQSLEGLADRCLMLERCLVGNILSFAKSLDVFFEEQIDVKLLDIIDRKTYRYKGIAMQGFDLRFKANVALPWFMALGKGVSIGFGEVRPDNITDTIVCAQN